MSNQRTVLKELQDIDRFEDIKWAAVRNDKQDKYIFANNIEIVQSSMHSDEVQEAIEDSYYRLDDFAVIKFKGYYFMTKYQQGSYIDNCGPWEQAKEVVKIVTTYEPITN